MSIFPTGVAKAVYDVIHTDLKVEHCLTYRIKRPMTAKTKLRDIVDIPVGHIGIAGRSLASFIERDASGSVMFDLTSICEYAREVENDGELEKLLAIKEQDDLELKIRLLEEWVMANPVGQGVPSEDDMAYMSRFGYVAYRADDCNGYVETYKP